MKIKFMCKLVITDDLDVTMEDDYSADVIANNIINELSDELSPRGKVTIEEPYLNMER